MSLTVTVEKLTGSHLTGAIVITVTAVLAMVVLSLTLLHMLLTMVPTYGHRMSNPQERKFITSPLGLYIICLFISNLISSLGGVVEAGWAGAGAIIQGPACTTQAFLLQLGGNATALWIALISMSALSTFMFRARSLSKMAAFPMIVLLWVGMILFDAVASRIFGAGSKQFFYGIAGMWCWITPVHPLARLFIQYVWMWVWSLVSAVCFLLVLLCVRGNIEATRDESGRRSFKWIKRSSSARTLGKINEQYQGLVGVVGKTMCWFPISYITLTVPMSVTRIAETFGFPVPAYAFVFAAVNFLLIGVVNSIIYIALRHSLKHASVTGSPDATLRGSFGEGKFGTESFEAAQEKRFSPAATSDPYPWTPTPTTKEWTPPSTHRGVGDRVTSPPTSVVAYAMTSGDDSTSAYRSSIVSDAPPRHVPVSTKLAQRSRSFHRPMESISTVTSSSTVMGQSVGLSPVSEADSVAESGRTELTVPPAAVVARGQSNPNLNIVSPSELDKLTNIPLSPVKSGHKRSETEASVYTGPRAISPDLNALLESTEADYLPSPTGPPPPPRKNRRSPTPSVPVDVDESDQGSFAVSPRPSVENFDRETTRPMSIGDITTRPSPQRADSMRTFWAAYEEPSRTPDVPLPADAADLKRDTMRTFWAAYEESSPTTPNMPSMPMDPKRGTVLDTKDWKPSAGSSQGYRRVDSSVFLKPSISAVGTPASSVRSGQLASESIYNKPAAASRALAEHRRSRSFNPMPTAPAPAVTSPPTALRPAVSAIARYGTPGLALREGPSRNTPTPTQSETNHTSDMSYRMPRSQPGYV